MNEVTHHHTVTMLTDAEKLLREYSHIPRNPTKGTQTPATVLADGRGKGRGDSK